MSQGPPNSHTVALSAPKPPRMWDREREVGEGGGGKMLFTGDMWKNWSQANASQGLNDLARKGTVSKGH